MATCGVVRPGACVGTVPSIGIPPASRIWSAAMCGPVWAGGWAVSGGARAIRRCCTLRTPRGRWVCSEDEADAWEVNGLGPDPWAALLGEGPEVNALGLAPEAWPILRGEGPDLAADAYEACCVDVNGGDERGDEGTALWSAPPSGCANCPRALRGRPPLGVAMMMLFALASAWYP